MPRYFFHVRDGDELILDHEGLELPDPEVLDECRSVVREVPSEWTSPHDADDLCSQRIVRPPQL